MIKELKKGSNANLYGFYSITIPSGEYTMEFSYIGYRLKSMHVVLDKDMTINNQLSDQLSELQEVVITVEKDQNDESVHSTQMSMINIPIDKIKRLPTIGGETDVIKVMQLMPGIKRGGEGQNGMFVRGGTGDGNLILLDEAVVYNVSHLFGFFSVFNNDALKDVTVYKGGFPASYGGRLSSVLDIRMKEGDQEKFQVEGGIGLLSSRVTVQGPILKKKMSFIVSARRSYIDQVFKLRYSGKNVLPYYFYDLTAKINYIVSNKDRIYLSSYWGDDVLKAQSVSDSGLIAGGFHLGNFTVSSRWNHLYSDKLFSNLSVIHTRFRYDVEGDVPGNSFLVKSRISDIGVKYDFNYYPNPENKITFGVMCTDHGFRPNVIHTVGEISEYVGSKEGPLITTVESGLYANDDHTFNKKFKLNFGLRGSSVVTQGIVYMGAEPRIAGTWSIDSMQAVKLSYTRMKQYMHLVSSSAISLPTDLWYPVTKNVRPQTADQVAAGYSRNFPKLKSIFTFEAYYKYMQHLIEYREGAVLILNDNYEEELIEGMGQAYGGEFFIQKNTGKFTGWVGYTISWATRQFDGLNQGKTYFAKYDRRHDLSIVGTYEFTKRISFSAVWVFSTGERFTALIGNYLMPNSALTSVDILNIYSDRNSIKLPPAHRLDVNLIIKGKDKKRWKAFGEWNIGAYNCYNRAQPYRVNIVSDGNGGYKYQAVGLFGFIPSVAWNFKF